MIEAPLLLAFAAGLVATLNPCGFAMLPAYLSYFMGLDPGGTKPGGREPGSEPESADLGSALWVGAIVSLGFLVVFGVTGLLINAGVRSIIDWIPFVALAIGVLMVVLGVAMWRGYDLSIGLLKVRGGTASRDPKSVFTFGVTYALASLSCTLPVFLSVVVGSITGASFVAGLATYLAYGLGMSTLLIALTIAVAFAKEGVVRRLRLVLRHINRISAAFLIVAGLYIAWFWLDDLTSDAGDQGAAAGLVEGWSASLTNQVAERPGTIGLVAGGVILLAALRTALKRFEPDTTPTAQPAGKEAR